MPEPPPVMKIVFERRTGEVGAKRTCLVHWTEYGGEIEGRARILLATLDRRESLRGMAGAAGARCAESCAGNNFGPTRFPGVATWGKFS